MWLLNNVAERGDRLHFFGDFLCDFLDDSLCDFLGNCLGDFLGDFLGYFLGDSFLGINPLLMGESSGISWTFLILL